MGNRFTDTTRALGNILHEEKCKWEREYIYIVLKRDGRRWVSLISQTCGEAVVRELDQPWGSSWEMSNSPIFRKFPATENRLKLQQQKKS